MFAILAPFLPAIVALVLVGGLYATHKVQVALAHRTGVKEATAQCDADKEVLRKRASDLALLWNDARIKGDKFADQLKAKQDATFKPLESRAAAVRRGIGIVLPDDVDSVWRDSSSSANASRSTAESAPRTGPVPDAAGPKVIDEPEFSTFQVKSAAAYRDAYDQWQGCVKFYDELRTAKPAGVPDERKWFERLTKQKE